MIICKKLTENLQYKHDLQKYPNSLLKLHTASILLYIMPPTCLLRWYRVTVLTGASTIMLQKELPGSPSH